MIAPFRREGNLKNPSGRKGLKLILRETLSLCLGLISWRRSPLTAPSLFVFVLSAPAYTTHYVIHAGHVLPAKLSDSLVNTRLVVNTIFHPVSITFQETGIKGLANEEKQA